MRTSRFYKNIDGKEYVFNAFVDEIGLKVYYDNQRIHGTALKNIIKNISLFGDIFKTTVVLFTGDKVDFKIYNIFNEFVYGEHYGFPYGK